MHLIVGLGNPGRIHARNRHNAGFRCLDYLAAKYGLSFDRKRFKAQVASGSIAGQDVILAKPQTYMNDSGLSVAEMVRWHRLPLSSLLVVYDDLDLPLATVRIRERGSSGGHRGMQSIIDHLKSNDFPRLRLGIGRPVSGDPIAYVLQNFSGPEQELMNRVCAVVAEATEAILGEGLSAAMNRFNTTVQDG
jgi:peptidyl-tRNA hydrolase, PTH1 family